MCPALKILLRDSQCCLKALCRCPEVPLTTRVGSSDPGLEILPRRGNSVRRQARTPSSKACLGKKLQVKLTK